MVPPMVGVPALSRCVCGPSERTTWPAFSAASSRITAGPMSRDMTSAVSAAMIVRKVMYWNTCRTVKRPASHSASSSSMRVTSRRGARAIPQRLDHALHAGRARTLDQARHPFVQLRSERGQQALLVGVVLAAGTERAHRLQAQRTGREQALDPA